MSESFSRRAFPRADTMDGDANGGDPITDRSASARPLYGSARRLTPDTGAMVAPLGPGDSYFMSCQMKLDQHLCAAPGAGPGLRPPRLLSRRSQPQQPSPLPCVPSVAALPRPCPGGF